MANSYIGGISAATNTVALPVGGAAGDLIIVSAYRNGSATAPGAITGYTDIISSAGANTNAQRIMARRFVAGDTTVGTSANATDIQAHILRGVKGTTVADCIGASTQSGSNASPLTLPTITLNTADGSSWVIGLVGAKGTGTNLIGVSGMTTRSDAVDTNEGAHTAENVSSFSASTYASQPVGSNVYRASSIEILSAGGSVITKTQGAVARIANLVTKTQGAIARIQTLLTKTQSAVARIANLKTKTQSAIARIATNPTKTQGAIARIQTLSTKTQPAKAAIQAVATKTQPVVARVANNLTKTQSATANITTSGALTKTQTATARIAVNLTKIQTAIGRIAVNLTKTQSATARVANIVNKTQPATARIANLKTKTQSAIGRIAVNSTKTQSAVARIANNFTKVQTAIARISAIVTKTQGAVARIAANRSKTQSATANIAVNTQTSPTVVLVSPDDGAIITDTTPQLTFIGTDSDGDAICYEIQVRDTEF